MPEGSPSRLTYYDDCAFFLVLVYNISKELSSIA